MENCCICKKIVTTKQDYEYSGAQDFFFHVRCAEKILKNPCCQEAIDLSYEGVDIDLLKEELDGLLD